MDSTLEDWLIAVLRARKGLLEGKNHFVDVGAYQGDFSAMLLDSDVFRNGLIFEPNPDTCGKLRDRFGSDPRVRIFPNACGDATGTVPMYCGELPYTGSLLPYAEEGKQVRGFDVELARLDDKLAADERSRVGLIKVDTQGNDLRVLRGARGMLAASRPLVVVEVIYAPLYDGQCQPEELGSFFQEMDYVKAAEMNEFVDQDGILAWSDACYMPREQVVAAHGEKSWRKRRTAGDVRDDFKRRPLKTFRRLLRGRI